MQPWPSLFTAVLGYGFQDFWCHPVGQHSMHADQGITLVARSVSQASSPQAQASTRLSHGRDLGIQTLTIDVGHGDLVAAQQIPNHHMAICDQVQFLSLPQCMWFDAEFHHEVHAAWTKIGILDMITVVDALGYVNVCCAHSHLRTYAHSASGTTGHVF